MNTSPNIADIAQALCKFQGLIKDAKKGKKAHQYMYADLGTILQLVRPVMAECGLSVVQLPCGDNILVGVTTRLMHNSGEWLEDTIYMGVSESRGMSASQSAGSAISYARRYALAAVLGITQVDNDAYVKDVEITPATDQQFESINNLIKEGKVSTRRQAWLKAEKNWNNLTYAQAESLLKEAA